MPGAVAPAASRAEQCAQKAHEESTGTTETLRHSLRDVGRLTPCSPRGTAIKCTHLCCADKRRLIPWAFGRVWRAVYVEGAWAGTIWRSSPGKRGAILHEALVRRPCCCIRRVAGDRAREVRFTRFLRNDRVSVAEMASHAASRTAERVAGREIIVIQDTSELILGGRRAKANGYGPVGKGGGTRGLLLHAALVLDADNDALLGLADVQVWNRDDGDASCGR